MLKPIRMPYSVGRVVIACGTLLMSPLNAEEINSNGRLATISLKEAITRTVTLNPELQAFNYELEAQAGRVVQAARTPSPEMNLEIEDALGTGNYQKLDSAQATMSISWVLERGVRQHYINNAQAETEVLSVEGDIQRLNAAAETARRYLESLAIQARMQYADKTVQLAQRTLAAVQRRVKAGKAPKAEIYHAKAELARCQLEREDLEHELLSSNRRLAIQWGETRLGFTQVEGDILFLPNITSLDELQSQLENNLVFTRLQSAQRLQKAQLALAKAKEQPNWTVSAGIRHMEGTGDQALVAGFSIPFGKNTRNPGRIAEIQANLEKIDLEKISARVKAETDLAVVYGELEHSLHVIKMVSSDVIPLLEQALSETRRGYSLGRYGYFELRSVQTELLDAQEMLIEASVAAHQQIINIEQLTGARLVQLTKAE